MKNSQRGFAPIVILIVIAIAIGGSSAYYISKNKKAVIPAVNQNSQATTTQHTASSTDKALGWKTYTNGKYGFKFNYPKGFTSLKEYPGGSQNCKQTETGKGVYVKSVVAAAMDNLGVVVVCEKLTQAQTSILNESVPGVYTAPADTVTTKTIGNGKAYIHYYIGNTGYENRVAQIPLDDSHYVEIGYTYGNSYRINPEFNGYQISEKEWDDLLSSFKIISPAQPVTSGWKTYTSSKYGFEFKYPATDILTDQGETVGLRAQGGSDGYGVVMVFPKSIDDAQNSLPIFEVPGRKINSRENITINGVQWRKLIIANDQVYLLTYENNQTYAITYSTLSIPYVPIQDIISTFRFIPSIPKTTDQYGNPLPVISTITPTHGPVGTVIEVVGKNLTGFESDLDLWFEDVNGVKGILYSENRPQSSIYMRATLPARLCQTDESYRGLPCQAWLNLVPGVYRVYTSPWGNKSNTVQFTVTAN